MPAPAQPLPIPLPINGLDRSRPVAEQPPGTTPYAVNTRTVDIGDRKRIGKRHGFGRAFTPQAGAAGNRRVTGLFNQSLATGSLASQGSVVETKIEAWAGYGAGVAPDLLGNFVWMGRSSAAAACTTIGGGNVNLGTDSFAVPALILTPPGGANRIYTLVHYHTTNDITGIFTATAQNAAANNLWSGCVVAIRGSDDWANFIQVRLVQNGANTVRLQLESQTGAVLATIANSPNLNLINATVGEVAGLSIEVKDLGGTQISVVMSWPGKAGDDAQWNGFTWTVTNNTFATNQRAGIGSDTATRTTTVRQIVYTRIRPAAPTVIQQINGTDTQAPFTNQYLLTSGWTSVSLTTLNALTLVNTPQSQAGLPPWPAIDQINDVIVGTDDGQGAPVKTCILTPNTVPGTAQWAVEFQYGIAGAYTSRPALSFRTTADFHNCLKMSFPASANNTVASKQFDNLGVGAIAMWAVVAGVRASVNTTTPVYVGYANDWVRVEDTGTDLKVSQHGITLFTANYSGQVGWTGGPGPPATVMAASNIVGFSETISTGLPRARIITLSQAASTAIGEYTARVLVLTSGIAQHGRLDQPTVLNTAAGSGLFNSLPMAFDFNNKWYAVDGGSSKIIDPIANTCVDWLATKGVFPAGCRLCCLYRGRAVVARQDANPSIWYMSRSLDPLDWLVGATPQSTAAIAGTDPTIGVPGDAITALIPFNEDLLLFGCARSMYMMEGDPGYKGAVQELAATIGVTGPRAWCFDEAGNLYFYGHKGLYRILRGTSQPVNIDGGRVPDVLDHINLDFTLIELSFDRFRGHVKVHLTPTDAVTQGYHVLFDVRTNMLEPLDQYPVFFGPWSACDIVGVADADRRYLIGGNDGFIRRPLDTVYNDDADVNGITQDIDSWVEIGPFELGRGDQESIIRELACYLGANTNVPVQWYWFTGASPEEVSLQTFTAAVATGIWGSGSPRNGTGFQANIGLRQRGGCHKLRVRYLGQAGTWSLERLWAVIQPRSRRR